LGRGEAGVISLRLQIALLIALCVYFLLVFYLLKKKMLNLKYTLLWLAAGLIMLVLTICPRLLEWGSAFVGVFDPTNALFAVIFFCVIIILMSLTAIVSKQNEKLKRIIQADALLEKRVRDLEKREITK